MGNIDIAGLLPYIGIAAAAVLAVLLAARIRRVVRRQVSRAKYALSGGAVAASLLKTAMARTDSAAAETPLTLSNLEGVYLPRIKAAYPALNPEDLRNRAGTALKEYLDSVRAHGPTPGLARHAAKSLCETTRHIAGAQYAGTPFTMHQALISGFDQGKIRFEVAYRTDRQRKATVEFAYMKEADSPGEAPEKKCTNCGAVLDSHAQAAGHCLYCDQVFKVVSEHAWLAVKIVIQ